jgi:hypothetical protein
MTGVWGWSRKRTINNLELFLKMNKSMPAGFAEKLGSNTEIFSAILNFSAVFYLKIAVG